MKKWINKIDDWFSQLQFKYQVLICGFLLFCVLALLIQIAGV